MADYGIQIALDYILTSAKGDGRPYVVVSVLGVKITGLLDSGATHTIIGSTGIPILRQLGFKWKERAESCCTIANGEKCAMLGSVCVPMEMEGRSRVINVLVVPSVKHALILGVNFWKEMGIVPDLLSGKWKFATTDVSEVQVHASRALTSHQQSELDNIMDGYSKKMGVGFGGTQLVEHVIETDSSPIKQRYYPVNPIMQRIIDEELDKMLEMGVVEPSSSGWSSPVLMVPKKDGTHRFCVDFRKLNAVTKRDAYPLPYISAILDRLRNATYLSSLDIKSAYWQVPVAQESRDYLSFTVPGRGLFRFCRMPFGLHNSPATWQRLIDKVLGPELEPFVFVYLDDIIVVTSTFEEHCQILKEVLDRLSKANLRLSLEKCQLCRSELKYLGYVVNEHGILVDPEKVSAILNLPTPTNVSGVRRLVGMASWYRRFIRNFASVTAPLTALLRKSAKFNWSNECEFAFSTIKNALVSAPILSCPDFELPFYLQTDASAYGIGAVLTQGTGDDERPICYLSRSLSLAERKYSVTERECLAVLWSIEKLRPYLEGTEFTVITDHYSLVWLNHLKDPHGRLARWAYRLQQYRFSVIHRKGRDHVIPDSLSRGVARDAPDVAAIDDISDPWIRGMTAKIDKNPSKFPHWRVATGKLYKHVETKFCKLSPEDSWKEIPPKTERNNIIQQSHDPPTSGHCGVSKTLARVQERYYWPKMRCEIVRYVKRCITCQQQKVEQKRPSGFMLSQPKSVRPWQVISVDLFGPLPRSKSGHTYVLGVADYFSKFVRLFPLRVANAKSVCKHLEEDIFLLFGAPQIMILDNGKQFVSKVCKELCGNYGVHMRFDAYYHAQANPIERVNRVLKTMLSCYVGDNHREWDAQLAKISCAISTAKHEVTGQSPYFVNFGRNYILHGKTHKTLVHGDNIVCDRTEMESRSSVFAELFKEIRRRLIQAYERNRKYYNLRHRDVEYNPGDRVWRKNFALSDASRYFSAKLSPRYVGPFLVKKKVSLWTYELEDEHGKAKGIWNVKDLKPFVASTLDCVSGSLVVANDSSSYKTKHWDHNGLKQLFFL